MRVSVALLSLVVLAAVGCRRLPSEASDGGTDGCIYAGQKYREGDSFPDADGCNTCFCEPGGAVACTLALCVDAAAQVCSYGGERYTIGASFLAADGCNVCFCPPSGQVGCTQRDCNAPDPG